MNFFPHRPGPARPWAKPFPVPSRIGQLSESPLHAALKEELARPGARFEVELEGYVIDVLQPDGELVEIQVGSFWPLRAKLGRLLDQHRIRLVHPVIAERLIVRLDPQGQVLSRRRSPLKGSAYQVFEHLVSIPTLLSHPNFTLEVLLCREQHTRQGKASKGRRELVDILERYRLRSPQCAARLLPDLPQPFSSRQLSQQLGCPLWLTQKFLYCLRSLELVQSQGRRGRTPLYAKVG